MQALKRSGQLVYDGDLTDRPVSNTSTRVEGVLTHSATHAVRSETSGMSRLTHSAWRNVLLRFFNNSIGFRLVVADTLQETQIDQNVDEGILVRDG